ncbi:MAG: helicase UvrD [Solirubrobacterales bacterium]|nr:helicase UvrD [Solirubrobacterales bacterium]
MVVAGAGSGKTDVMARRIAWWVAVDGVPKSRIVAFTFTRRAAEEMQFRIRQFVERVTPVGEDVTLGDMYVGTIHGFCVKMLRDLASDEYHNLDVLEEGARVALVQRGYHGTLGLPKLQSAMSAESGKKVGQFATISRFLKAYDLLNEYDELEVVLPTPTPPARLGDERDWCHGAEMKTDVGVGDVAEAFELAAGRLYAFERCRRFLDHSTSQSELLRLLRRDEGLIEALRERTSHLVVDEVQDINQVQSRVIAAILGETGHLTCVGDHRQAIFAWRGGRVEIMADIFEELSAEPYGEVIELTHNFRSTPRIIEIANRWAASIGAVQSMSSPDMEHGRTSREDEADGHIAALAFEERTDEADWIAEKILTLADPQAGLGAAMDVAAGEERGLTFADVAILIRSGTDARTYMRALQAKGIPAVFTGGDLFSQPEILFVMAALAVMAGIEKFYGNSKDPRSLPGRITQVLDCEPIPEAVLRAAAAALASDGLLVVDDVAYRLMLAARLFRARIEKEIGASKAEREMLATPDLRAFLARTGKVRRVFPQEIFHLILSEAGVHAWDGSGPRGDTAMFHLGALSALVQSMETPGWTSPSDFTYQVVALGNWAPQQARLEEAPLLEQPEAVTISTVHSVKGAEYAAVFLADVCSRRFPSSFAKRVESLPFESPVFDKIDPAELADNENLDNERRLMYVALTRAERFLAVTCSGKSSPFFKAVQGLIEEVGGETFDMDLAIGPVRLVEAAPKRENRLVSTFSDLRYYLECPHDFYLRKVLGFAPTIDQAFGYGRGVHNLLRAIHSEPARWSEIAINDSGQLRPELEKLVDAGLFYLRYTTGEPLERMQNRGLEIVSDYVLNYATELAELEFEPEREFETLIEEEQVLISGAIDLVRHDDPPTVTLVDFKSGEPESDVSSKLDREEMQLQISLYGVAAKKELEYEPEQGLVRYLGEADPDRRELKVPLDDDALAEARHVVAGTARSIKERTFESGPTRKPRDDRLHSRCEECDFMRFCGMPAAETARQGS